MTRSVRIVPRRQKCQVGLRLGVRSEEDRILYAYLGLFASGKDKEARQAAHAGGMLASDGRRDVDLAVDEFYGVVFTEDACSPRMPASAIRWYSLTVNRRVWSG